MKRKRMWLLAALPVVVGLAWAEPVADKNPRLVARDVFVAPYLFSADGKQMFVLLDHDSWDLNAKDYLAGYNIAPMSGLRTKVFSDSIDSYIGFSPDKSLIYQVDLDTYEGFVNDTGDDLRHPRPDGVIGIIGRDALHESHATIRFTFPGERADFYGAYVRGDEIIAESREMTYHLDARNLRVLKTEPRTRTLTSVWLLNDGKTLLKHGLEFADLETEKILWKWPTKRPGFGFVRFDSKGRFVLSTEGAEIVARDVRTGKQQWRFRGPQTANFSLSPDGSAIYEARENGELWKWPR